MLYSGVCLFHLEERKTDKTKQNRANQNTGQLQLSVAWEREFTYCWSKVQDLG